MDSENTEIGQRVALIRGQDSQQAFADKIGVHRNTLRNYEKGERSPDASFMQKMASLGINMNWLVTGEGEPNLSSSTDQERPPKIMQDVMHHLDKDVFSEVIQAIRDEKSEVRSVNLDLLIDHIVQMYNNVILYSNSEYRVLSLALYVNTQSQLMLHRSVEWFEKTAHALPPESAESAREVMNKRLEELKKDQELFLQALSVTKKDAP